MIYLERIWNLIKWLFILIVRIVGMFTLIPIAFVLQISVELIVAAVYYVVTGNNYWDFYYPIIQSVTEWTVNCEKFEWRKKYYDKDRTW